MLICIVCLNNSGFYFFLHYLLYEGICVCTCAHTHIHTHMEGTRSPGAGVTGDCEAPAMGAGSPTWVLYKSSVPTMLLTTQPYL